MVRRKTWGTGETPAAADDPPTMGDQRTALSPGANGGADMTLLSFCERFERLSEEIKALSEDRTEIMSEAKASGFDTKTLRQAIRRRAMAADDRMEADALLELYEEALDRAGKKAMSQSIEEGA